MNLSLTDIESKYLRYLEATGRIPSTVANYRRLFLNLVAFSRDQDLELSTGILTTDLVREFHHWRMVTPLKSGYRGSIKRTPGGIFLQLELIKRLIGWLHEEGLLAHPVKVTLPRVPFRRRTSLTPEQLNESLPQSASPSGITQFGTVFGDPGLPHPLA